MKIVGLNELAPKVPEKIFDWPKARKKIWPSLLREGGCPGGTPPPAVPSCQKEPWGWDMPPTLRLRDVPADAHALPLEGIPEAAHAPTRPSVAPGGALGWWGSFTTRPPPRALPPPPPHILIEQDVLGLHVAVDDVLHLQYRQSVQQLQGRARAVGTGRGHANTRGHGRGGPTAWVGGVEGKGRVLLERGGGVSWNPNIQRLVHQKQPNQCFRS